MKPICFFLAGPGRILARVGIVLLLAGCQTSRPPAHPVKPPALSAAPLASETASRLAFFTVRSLDQDGTRENARRESVKTYQLHLQHPEFTGPAFRGLNRIIRTFILDTKKDFVQSTMEVETSQLDSAGFPWTLEVRFNLACSSPRFISLLFTRTIHTGGTQFNYDFYTINYDLSQQKELLLPDLLATPFALNSLSALVISRLQQQPNLVTNAQMLQGGAGPLADNYVNFTLNAEVLSVQFVPGQVADISSGPQHVELPLSQIVSLLRPEVFAWLKPDQPSK